MSNVRRWVEVAAYASFALTSIYVLLFSGLKSNVALNRNNDSWVHVAEADEYLRTGVFAADPFIEGAPPFGVFGVQELMTANIARFFTGTSEAAWSWTLALTLFLATWASFVCGVVVGRGPLAGWYAFLLWISLSGWLGFHGQMGLHGLGFAFPSSVSLLSCLIVCMLWTEPARRWRHLRPLIWGASSGALFGLHSLTGLLGCLLIGPILLADLLRMIRVEPLQEQDKRTARWAGTTRAIIVGLLFCAGFLIVAQPWVRMQWELRPLLATMNAQGTEPPVLALRYVLTLLAASAAYFLSLFAMRQNKALLLRLMPVSIWVAMLLIGCVPMVNAALARVTSSHMAARVCSLAPLPIMAGVVCLALAGCILRGRRYGVLAAAVVMGVALLPLKHFAEVHLYLLRTNDLDTHWFGHLQRLRHLDLEGKVLLSDPMTSYFARPMLGTYVIGVPGELSSPVVPAESRMAHARDLLIKGVTPQDSEADVVVFEFRRNLTPDFSGVSAHAIRDVWISKGWRVVHEDADIVAMMPATP